MKLIRPAGRPLSGTIVVPGDKSITHRAFFFGALNRGVTRIHGGSPAADCRATANLLRTLGYALDDSGSAGADGCPLLTIDGARRTSSPPSATIDCDNSGTTARLGMGFLTGESGKFTLTGDESLRRRPMGRVTAPLAKLGARIEMEEGRLPALVHGEGGVNIHGASHGVIGVASAQVHGALVLAGLRSRGGVMLCREAGMRDHTIRMLRHFGVDATPPVNGPEKNDLALDYIRPTEIDREIDVDVPGDISSAAFWVVAALIVPGSAITIENVGLNPTRISFLNALSSMGAVLAWEITRHSGGEPVGRIFAEYSPHLSGIELNGEASGTGGLPELSVAEMMDELPLLALVASRASGGTIVRGARELRLKESDRIAATLAVLRDFGVRGEELEDGFIVQGPQRLSGGGVVDHHGDHRLCMMAAVAALAAAEPVTIAEPEVADVSYPGFWEELDRHVT